MSTTAIPSRIDAVTVYRRGALVERVAELDASAGALPGEVRLTGLPLAAEDASFRVRVAARDAQGPAGVIARDVRVALEAPEPAALEPPPDEAELRRARLEEARRRARVSQLDDDLKRLEALLPQPRPRRPRGEAPPASPSEARLTLLSFRAQRSEALTEERIAAVAALQQATRLREELEDRARRGSDAQRPPAHELRKTAVVSLSPEAGQAPAHDGVRLTLEYHVPGACWAPAYTLRLDAEGEAGALALRGLVAQRSGEDWEGVRLTLSTADPSRVFELPELASLRIGRSQRPAPRRGWAAPPQGAEQLYADWDRAFATSEGGALRTPAPAPAAEPEAVMALEEAVSLDFEEMGGARPAFAAMASAPVAPAPASLAAPLTRGSSAASRAPKAAMRRAAPRGTTGSIQPVREPPPGLGGDDPRLAYAALRLPGPGETGRGRLVVSERLELYFERHVHWEVEWRRDVERALERAGRRADAAREALPSQAVSVESAEAGFDCAWRAEHRVDVPSDRAHHAVPLLERPAEIALRHVCVPRESSDVFRQAELRNPLPGPLLAGPVDVYAGDAYLLTARLPATPEGAALELGLGADSAVKASRNARYREETKGITGGRLDLAHEIEIEVRNNQRRPIRLEVRERVPVAAENDPDVQVALGEVRPAWEEWTPEARPGREPLRGGHRWRVEVAQGEKVSLHAAYRVRLGTRHELVGGNRREP